MARLAIFAFILSFFLAAANAQFGGNFFEQMFQAHGQQQQQQQPRQNAPSDSLHYQREFDSDLHTDLHKVQCDKYLCPGTLACVHFPHHCPCAFPGVEDKVELGDGIAICASKGGYKEGEMQRKVELARKGLL